MKPAFGLGVKAVCYIDHSTALPWLHHGPTIPASQLEDGLIVEQESDESKVGVLLARDFAGIPIPGLVAEFEASVARPFGVQLGDVQLELLA